MAHSAVSEERRIKRTKAERARQYLVGGGVTREDSDDELGLDDHPWEWIYDRPLREIDGNRRSDDTTMLEADGAAPGSPTDETRKPRKRKASEAEDQTESVIIGARMGDFRCRVGDTVLLKSEANGEAWIGIICEFVQEEDGQKAANFMWFSSEREIRNKQKKRTDALQNELYLTPSWDVNPLTSINGRASIVSAATYLSKYPNGRVPRGSKDYGKIFICRRGCNTRTATYTEEFNWEEIYHGTDEDIYNLIERVKTETKATRQRRSDSRAATKPENDYVADETVDVPETPRKRRKIESTSTPRSERSVRTPQKPTTPSQKRVIVKKPLEFTPLGTRILSPSHTSASPFQLARSKLHVASVPNTLPCREAEFATVYSHLEAAISDGSGSCIYISGTPGTGKTATVREVVSQLNGAVQNEELDDFIFVEINGMKVTDPHQSYSLLWEALRGERVSPSHALDLLEREFSNPSPRRVPCVVLMDELDQLVTKNQSVMYNFFNWPGLRHSRLIVLAVANTMDLPERTLSNKISSRLGLTRITFPGYTHDQLMKIIESRLEGVAGDIVDPDAVQFASRKVAAVSGDARRALDICRRAVELAEEEEGEEEEDDGGGSGSGSGRLRNEPSTPSKDPSKRALLPPPPPTPSKRKGGGKEKGKGKGKVTIATIKYAINEATTSPLQQYLRGMPTASKLFLAAVLARLRRTGISEAVLGDVIDEALRMAQMIDVHLSPYIRDFLLLGDAPGAGAGPGAGNGLPISSFSRVRGMSQAAVELMEAGVVALEARKGERTGKVRLNVGEEEIKLALREDVDARTLGFV
ncbi:MAG: Origin recognition complex, subunit 1 [Thelocarpon superellum]|nr:MAG: Origin recognition complex, subunit 1 [Thelocarpon superellum]